MSQPVSQPPITLTPTPSFSTLTNYIHLQSPPLLSRLLYTSPCCILTSPTSSMTITWTTCSNNKGNIILCINRKRETLKGFKPHVKVGLSICNSIPTLKHIGSSSGPEKLLSPPVPYSTFSSSDFETYQSSVMLKVELIKCIDDEDDETVTWKGIILEGWVKSDEWNGKIWTGERMRRPLI